MWPNTELGHEHGTGWQRLLLALLLFLLLLLVMGCAEPPQEAAPAGTEQAAPVATDPVASGRAAYEDYCASCHGPEGRGDGPVAVALRTPPTDLTTLRRQHGGTFQGDSIYSYIDGREYVQAHGTRQMPVWGNIWSEDSSAAGGTAAVDRRIRELVEYLRSIQEA